MDITPSFLSSIYLRLLSFTKLEQVLISQEEHLDWTVTSFMHRLDEWIGHLLIRLLEAIPLSQCFNCSSLFLICISFLLYNLGYLVFPLWYVAIIYLFWFIFVVVVLWHNQTLVIEPWVVNPRIDGWHILIDFADQIWVSIIVLIWLIGRKCGILDDLLLGEILKRNLYFPLYSWIYL